MWKRVSPAAILSVPVLIIVIVLVLLVAGCSSTEEVPVASTEANPKQDPGVFRVNLTSNPTTVDPAQAVTDSELLLIRALYETLVEIHDGEIQPALAESWRYSEDGRELYIRLRKDLKFSNGKAITAADVEYSIERLTMVSPPSPYASFVTAFLGGSGSVVNSIQVIDNSNLVIRFPVARRDFVEMLAHPCFSVVSHEDMEIGTQVRGGTYFVSTKPFGSSGPMSLVEWINNRSIALEPNKQYYAEAPKIDRLELIIEDNSEVTMYCFGTQTLDLVYLQQADLERLTLEYSFIEEQLSVGPANAVYFLSFNSRMPVFRGLETRQAVVSSIDLSSLVGVGQLFEVSESPLGTLSRNNGIYSGNPRALFHQFASGTFNNELVLSYPRDEISRFIGENLKGQIEDALGITVKLQEMASGSPLLYDDAAHLSLVRWDIPPVGKNAFFPYFFGQGVNPFVNGNPVGQTALSNFRQAGAFDTDRKDYYLNLIADEISGQFLLYSLVDGRTLYAIQEDTDIPEGLKEILGISG